MGVLAAGFGADVDGERGVEESSFLAVVGSGSAVAAAAAGA